MIILGQSSASQVNVFEDCIRKWAWSKIEKLKVSKSGGALLGSETHRQIDDFYAHNIQLNYLGNARQRKAAELAEAIIRHLPKPGTRGLETERKDSIIIGDIEFILIIDMSRLDLPIPWIEDHKTTSDFKWTLSEKDLLLDPQACLYAYYALVKTGKPHIDLQWTYAITKGKINGEIPTKVIRKRVNLNMIEYRMGLTIETSRHLSIIRNKNPEVLQLPYNAETCTKYGGCAFVDNCALTPRERLKSIMSEPTNKAAEFLSALKKRNAVNAGTASAVNPPEAVPEAVPNESIQETSEEKPLTSEPTEIKTLTPKDKNKATVIKDVSKTKVTSLVHAQPNDKSIKIDGGSITISIQNVQELRIEVKS